MDGDKSGNYIGPESVLESQEEEEEVEGRERDADV